MTNLLYHTDSYLRDFDAIVTAVDGQAIALDRTAFYATSGGQPHDTGTLHADQQHWHVTDVRSGDGYVWHTLAEESPPTVGMSLHGVIDWERRYHLMRMHTALHILCGVIWRDHRAPVTGGNMDPTEGRLDFEIADFSNDRAHAIIEQVNAEVAADRPILVRSLPRHDALQIPDLVRTKVNLIPESVQAIRIVEIVGLDMQADGGTHVARTSEVGHVILHKTRSKGAKNKRIIIRLETHATQS